MRKLLLFALFLLGVCFTFNACSPHKENGCQKNLELVFEKPATDWMSEGLPIGNAHMGAMLFGGVHRDEIQFSEESLWAGGPGEYSQYNGGNKKDGWKHLSELRKLLREGKTNKVNSIAEKYFTGVILGGDDSLSFRGYGAQQPMGSVFVTMPDQDDSCQNYLRKLNLNNAISSVSYSKDDVNYSNEYFASYPRRVVVSRYSNDADKGRTYVVNIKPSHGNTTTYIKDNVIGLRGTLHNNGMQYRCEARIKTDGEIIKGIDAMEVHNASWIEIYLTAATDYINSYPSYKGNDFDAQIKRTFSEFSSWEYGKLKSEHVADYNNLFGRVELDLGKSPKDTPRDMRERLLRYGKGMSDPELEVLLFQYGRYLLIASSRPGSMPAHLQGKWNNSTNPPWACDYHMDINLQMNYWPAEVTNLSECHEPLMDYIESLQEPGRITAREYFNARGWVVNTMNNPFGYTAPGWSFFWGYGPGCSAWLSQHLWEHYAFTNDKVFLKEKAWPIMKEVSQFWLDYLCEDTDGSLVSSPSFSPEHGKITAGCTMDQEFAWDILSNCINASRILGDCEQFRDSLIDFRNRLSGLKIGRYGQLQEWKSDIDSPSDKHRHVSHLFALYPGSQISINNTPLLTKAAQKSLEMRGDDGTGWSLAWKVNLWARLHNGGKAYQLLNRFLRIIQEKTIKMNNMGGVYSNLLCAHPPFQVDGNFGVTAAMAEMLLQSHEGEIALLPALPDAWAHGKVKGLKARGNFTVDISWDNGSLNRVTILSPHGGNCMVNYRGSKLTFATKAGEKRILEEKDFFNHN